MFGLGLFAAAFSARAEHILEATGTAEANPDLYVYSVTISTGCLKSEEAVDAKSAELEQALAKTIKPFLDPTQIDEDQYYSTSDNLPEENSDNLTAYKNNNDGTGAQVTICTPNHWSYNVSYLVKLLDASKRRDLGKALVNVAKTNTQSNPGFEKDKETWAIGVSAPTPQLKTETRAALFEAAYRDALRQASAKYKTIMIQTATDEGVTPENLQTYIQNNLNVAQISRDLRSVEEKKDESGRPIYAFAAMDVPVGDRQAANAGTQKLKLQASFVFTFN